MHNGAKMKKNPGTSTLSVKVKPGLSKQEGQKAVWNAAKKNGKTDARGITYDPKTGNGKCT